MGDLSVADSFPAQPVTDEGREVLFEGCDGGTARDGGRCQVGVVDQVPEGARDAATSSANSSHRTSESEITSTPHSSHSSIQPSASSSAMQLGECRVGSEAKKLVDRWPRESERFASADRVFEPSRGRIVTSRRSNRSRRREPERPRSSTAALDLLEHMLVGHLCGEMAGLRDVEAEADFTRLELVAARAPLGVHSRPDLAGAAGSPLRSARFPRLLRSAPTLRRIAGSSRTVMRESRVIGRWRVSLRA